MRLLPWAPHIEHPTLHTHTHSQGAPIPRLSVRIDMRDGTGDISFLLLWMVLREM